MPQTRPVTVMSLRSEYVDQMRSVAGRDQAWASGKEFIALLRHYQLPQIQGRAGAFSGVYWVRSARTATGSQT
jgi:hypothetical protein